MNRQEVFNKVSTHLLSQMRQALGKNYFYAYKTKDGLKCAIGCLIPDNLYDPKIEGLTIRDIMEISSQILFSKNILEFKNILETELGPLNNDDLIFLKDLQLIHDFFFPDTWKKKLENLAKSSNLVFELKENKNANN